jgi:hypothetical protein
MKSFRTLGRWVRSMFEREPKPRWKTVTLSVCWVCGTAMDEDSTCFIHMKRGPYCMRHEVAVNEMRKQGED